MSQSDVLGVPPSPFPTPPIAPRRTAAEPKRNQSRLRWLGLWVAYFAVVNLLVFPSFYYLVGAQAESIQFAVTAFLAGNVLAQLPLLTVIAVLGPGTDLVRQGFAWTVGLLWLACYAAGMAFSEMVGLNHAAFSQRDYAALFSFPFVFCACQTPLWIMRYFFRWRTGTSGNSFNSCRISILGIMVATSVVAATLALCRAGLMVANLEWGPPESRWASEILHVSPSDWWFDIGMTTFALTIVSAAALPFIIALILRSRYVVLGQFISALYLAIGAAVMTGFLAFYWGTPGMEGYLRLVVYYFLVSAHLITLLSLMRSAGYRLWWGRETAGAAEKSSQATSSQLAE